MTNGQTDIDESSTEKEEQAPKAKNSRFALQAVATFLSTIGFLMIIGVGIGFYQGWLLPAWQSLTDAQGSIIASLVTLYAAALAAIVGPLIFTGQISNMQGASERAIAMIDAQNQRMNEQLEHIRKMVRQTEEAVVPSAPGTEFDQEKAIIRLEGIREDATAIAQSIVEKSNKWKTTKDKTKRKWPGRKPYYRALHNLGFISEAQRDLFFQISDTRLIKADEVSAEDISTAENQLQELKASVAVA